MLKQAAFCINKSKGLQKFRKKGSYTIKLKTLFGDISFESPRYYGQDKKTFSPLKELLANHTTPELFLYLFLQRKRKMEFLQKITVKIATLDLKPNR